MVLNYDKGELKHLNHMYIAGYLINKGDMSNLTNLQKLAIIIMKNERDKYYNHNKAILTTGG